MLTLAQGWTAPKGKANDIYREAIKADAIIKPFVYETPVELSPWLGQGTTQVHLKMESEQRTGSFKARGALNKVLSLSPLQLASGLVTCSTGNHALAFLYACKCLTQQQQQQQQQQFQAPTSAMPRPIVYLPTTASKYKAAKLKSQDIADVIMFGSDCVEAELEAVRVAAGSGATYVSPYNDWQVIAGQGTVSMDLMRQLPRSAVDVVFIPVGGGGLISGMAAVLKAADPNIRVVGCQPAASDVMRQSVLAGVIVEIESGETFSDATAGGIEPGAVTLQPCTTFVDEWVTVTEEEIGRAVVGMLSNHSKLVEGAAGCAIAAFLKKRESLAGKSAVILCCGGNMSTSMLKDILGLYHE